MSRVARAPAGGLMLVVALAAGASGCGRFETPPVELTFRDSLVGAGKIVQVANTSNEPLASVAVTISAPSGESRTFTQDELGGFETIEIGWKKLGGWQIPLGSEIEIGADGYLLAFKGRLPDEKEAE